MLELFRGITPQSAVVCALITTCGGLLVRRCFCLADRREQREDRCERYENAYDLLSIWSRQFSQSVISLSILQDKPKYGPGYVRMRLLEMAAQPTPFDRYDKYVEGAIQLSDIEAEATPEGGEKE